MSDAEYNNMTPRQMEFAVFCVMCVAEELQKPATEIYDLMMQTGFCKTISSSFMMYYTHKAGNI